MVGYRYMWSRYEGLREGTNGISNEQLLHTEAPHGTKYSAAPLKMDMHMHMLEFMYSATEWLGFMVAPQYVQMDMSELHAEEHHEEGGDAEHGEQHENGLPPGTHSHGTAGWGDTSIAAMVRLFNAHRQTVLLNIGLSLPTGSVSETVNGSFAYYGMQPGSGTFDLLPGITHVGQSDHFSWGAQYSAIVRLEDQNDSGFRKGDIHQVTAWGAVKLSEWASLSARIQYRTEGAVRGHYSGEHFHSSPYGFPRNYGGDTLDLGIGLNFYVPRGLLKGNRLAIEALMPVYQDVNGIQLERDVTLYAGWQWSY